jgi:hypothetical protein
MTVKDPGATFTFELIFAAVTVGISGPELGLKFSSTGWHEKRGRSFSLEVKRDASVTPAL